ncbi:MAG: YciI family protein [Actinomycetota bacterium]
MRYLLTLIGEEGGREDDMTPEQWRAAMDPWNDYNRQVLDAGVFVAGDGLHPSSTATTVRLAESGDQTVTDGPFAETKEQLGGFYVLECVDLDEALDWAKKVPIRPGGAVEVRPAMDFSEFGYLDPYAEAASAR